MPVEPAEATTLENWLLDTTPILGYLRRRVAAWRLAADPSPDATALLAQAVALCSDAGVNSRALHVLRQRTETTSPSPSSPRPSTRDAHLNAIFSVWRSTPDEALLELLESRVDLDTGPPRIAVFVALSRADLDAILGAGAEVVQHLAEASGHADETIAGNARTCLFGLEEPEALDELCRVWFEDRSDLLEHAVVQAGHIPDGPPRLRATVALKLDRPGEVAGDPQTVPGLINALDDPEPEICARARHALLHLSAPQARDALCEAALEPEQERICEIALEAGYVPDGEQLRALFFFLTDQWERYDSLDFDRSLLRAGYVAGSEGVRGAVQERVRRMGRVDLLQVISGPDIRVGPRGVSGAEAHLLVDVLASRSQWQRLWSLAFELPYQATVRIVDILRTEEFRPERAEDAETFSELVSLVADLPTDIEELRDLVPPAVHRASMRAPGNINDVEFAPSRPVIAIGTGHRRLLTWNFQKGAVEQVFGDFGHSIGNVTFTGDGTLVCAERTNTPYGNCAIYAWHDDTRVRLGEHAGSVTSVCPVGGSRALSTGRDSQVCIWETRPPALHAQGRFRFWARSSRVCADGSRALLLHRGVTLVSVPNLERVADTWGSGWRHVATCGAFLPGDRALLVGQYTGKTVLLEQDDGRLIPHWGEGPMRSSPVRATEVIPGHDILAAAWSDGTIELIDINDLNSVGTIRPAQRHLTSLHVSGDGAFMAVGTSEATMSLWDLRVMHVPVMLARPFAQTTPKDLRAVEALSEAPDIRSVLQKALRFAMCVLKHRFRYDIEVEQAQAIKPGEYDIEVE